MPVFILAYVCVCVCVCVCVTEFVHGMFVCQALVLFLTNYLMFMFLTPVNLCC